MMVMAQMALWRSLDLCKLPAWRVAPFVVFLTRTCSWTGESGLPTDLLLVHIALQPSKGVCLPCVRHQDFCVQYMARTTHTHSISPAM